MTNERARRRLTRRRFLAGAGSLAALALANACGDDDDAGPTPDPTATSPEPTASADTPAPRATPTPTGPSLEEMVGSMLMLGFRGTELTPDNPIVADLQERHVGGVLLFSYDLPSGTPVRNIASPAQVAELTRALREASPSTLFIAVDQEGGQVARLGPMHGFPDTPSAAELGRMGPAATAQAAADIAATLVQAGINFNLAPVVDLDTNPGNPVIGGLGRSFGADPGLVTAHAEAFIDAHRAAGVLTALKHFPGHGSSEADSHLGFTDVTATWDAVELEPYRALIAAGKAEAVMAAHLFNATIDETYPASLSEATIGGLLRRELGFEGVVVSDDMQMGAITQHYGFEEAIRLAILAGNDILVYGNNLEGYDPDLGHRAFAAILGLIHAGDVSPERFAESYARIQALKQRLA